MPKWCFRKIVGMSKMRFSKRNCIFCFCLLYVAARETEKKKKLNGKGKKPIKSVFFKVVIQQWEKWKYGFLAKITWHYLCEEGRKTRIFVHTICFGPKMCWTKTVKTRKNNKNRGFSGNRPTPKMTPFLKKLFFDMGEKVGFTNCVFESCALPKTLFL